MTPRTCRFCGVPVEAPTPEERNRFRLRGRDVCLACDARRFPPPPPPVEPRCPCGSQLQLELGPGLRGSVVISAYCESCDELTMPYLGPLPSELHRRLQSLRRERPQPAGLHDAAARLPTS